MKKMLYKICVLWGGILFLLSCESTQDTTVIYDPEKIPVYHCNRKDSLPIDGIGAMMIIPSSQYLVTLHFQEDHFFKVFSKSDYSFIGSAVPMGRGPGEIPWVGYIDQWKEEDGHLKILTTPFDWEYAWVDIDLALTGNEEAISRHKLQMPQEHQELKGVISTINYLSEDSILLYTNSNRIGNKIEHVIPYYALYNPRAGKLSEPYRMPVIEGKSEGIFSAAYSNVASLSPNKCYCVDAMRGLKTIQITNFKDYSVKVIKFPDSPKRMELVDPNSVNFTLTRGSERFAWVANATGTPQEVISNQIYLIDWQGKPRCTLTIDKNILAFAPAENEKALYVVDRIEGVFRYDLQDFYDKFLPTLKD